MNFDELTAAERSFVRGLCLVQRLASGPADLAALVGHVRARLGWSAYPDEEEEKALQRRFEDDLARLRRLGVGIEYERAGRVYVLRGYGDLPLVALGDRELDALAFLQETFGAGAPNAENVRRLVDAISGWLPNDQAASLQRRRQQFRVDLRSHDEQDIDRLVQEQVQTAIRRGRLLRFGYRAMTQADNTPRLHTVQPWQIVFDAVRGHLYLDAYWLESSGPRGRRRQQRWQQFRIDRILRQGLEMLPDKRPPTPPPRPRHKIEYLLSPEITRVGQVTRHFDRMEVHAPGPDGWVRVSAETDDLFRGVRLLLPYGGHCRVVGGPEARRQMEELVAGLAVVYAAPLQASGGIGHGPLGSGESGRDS